MVLFVKNRQARVWLNHWFSSAYHIIKLIRNDNNIDFYIIGTNENNNSVIKTACDEWYIEPRYENDAQYVDFCLKFCKINSIDIFVPRRGMLAICKRIKEFEQIDVKVLIDNDYSKVAALNDKQKTYELFLKHNIGFIPPNEVINTIDEFKHAYDKMACFDERVCFKFVQDEGATSFRVIDNSMEGYNGLYKLPGLKITYKDALAALCQPKKLPSIIVMPYLSGQEVSVDCLKTLYGNVIIPRYKTNGRIEEIKYDKDLIGICNSFYDKIGINYPCNIQFKYHKDIPYLLEVNTRMSGGIQLACLGADVNIPNIAVNQLLSNNKNWEIKKLTQMVSHVETPILI